MAGRGGFGAGDWAIIVAGVLALPAIGWHFARRSKTTEAYFVAGRNQRPWLAGVSLFAALFTLVAYLGVPGEMIQHGPVLILGSVAALPFSYWLIGHKLIPAFMRLPITSGYELLETRLGRTVRTAAAGIFVVVRIVWMALILYASSAALVGVTGWGPRAIPLLEIAIGFLAAGYTLAGGIEAAMATAVLEFGLLMLGAVLTVGLVTWRTGQFGAGWLQDARSGWDAQPWLPGNWHVRVSVASTVISYFISTVCAGGSDQVAIQRYLTTRDARAARRAVLFGHLAVGSILLLLGVVGAALLGYYRAFPRELPPGHVWGRGGDTLFPYFISHALPPGLSGLMVAGLLTSAVSGIGPSINSVIAVIERDFLDRGPGAARRSDQAKLRSARWLALGLGLVAIGTSFGLGRVRGNLIEVSGKTVNVFFYPMFGLFFFALYARRATAASAMAGSLAGLAAGLTVGYWDVLTGGAPVSFQWIGPISLTVTLGVGTLLAQGSVRQPLPRDAADPQA